MTAADENIIESKPDHALGQYKSWRLTHGASAPIDMAWLSVAHARAPAQHRLLPHGEPSIVISRKRDSNNAITECALVICGPYHQTGYYTPVPREELIGFRIMPEHSAVVFGVAPIDYADRPTSQAPARLIHACSRTLELAARAPAREIFAALQNDLRQFLIATELKAGPEAQAALWLRHTNGTVRLRHVAQSLDISERTLRRRFLDHVGCSPKAYARQLQLTNASLIAEQTPAPDWAAIAAEAGFHDQSHMINAFRTEMGMTPAAFHAERRALAQG
ncbi:helix-turn-helix domain-containing protein [Hyphococcus sp.]|uniref:helix-turn-helix domain-containing protein n=1 Tax=Hyphococcus sp. TaxID=2038636 RepID=UPI003CCB9A93